ncbi:MAG: hypothetical protein GY820_39215 [Gammaproteobacteria bacterium]|nr:hypothetical protein [Gammaproteobacteria bacterium]
MGVRHTYRTAIGYKTDLNFTRGKAIRQKCLDCTCWQTIEIRKCTAKNCALYPFRMGSVTLAQEIEKSRRSEEK